MRLRCQNLPALMRHIGQLEEAAGADFCSTSRRSLAKYALELQATCRHQPLFQDRASAEEASGSRGHRRLLAWDGTPHVVAMTDYRWCAMRAPKSLGRNRTQPALLLHRGRGGGGGCGTGCTACVIVKAVMRFPQYRLEAPDRGLQSLVSHRLRYLMSKGRHSGEVWYYAYFPRPEEHNHRMAPPANSPQQPLLGAGGDADDDRLLITLDPSGRPVAREPTLLLGDRRGEGGQQLRRILRQLDMVDCVVRSETSFLALLHRLQQQQLHQQPPSLRPPGSLPPGAINWHSASSVMGGGVDLDESSGGADSGTDDGMETGDLSDHPDAEIRAPGRAPGIGGNVGNWKPRRGRPLKDPLLPRPARLTAEEVRSLGVVGKSPPRAAVGVESAVVAERLEAAEARICRLESQVTRLTSLIGCDPTA